MGDIVYLPGTQESAARRLAALVDQMIAEHPDPCVAERWSAMARETIRRYPAPPSPSQPMLDFDGLDTLSRRDRECVLDLAERWLSSYFVDVNAQLMSLHREMLSLQRQVAEHECKALVESAGRVEQDAPFGVGESDPTDPG